MMSSKISLVLLKPSEGRYCNTTARTTVNNSNRTYIQTPNQFQNCSIKVCLQNCRGGISNPRCTRHAQHSLDGLRQGLPQPGWALSCCIPEHHPGPGSGASRSIIMQYPDNANYNAQYAGETYTEVQLPLLLMILMGWPIYETCVTWPCLLSISPWCICY